MNARQPPNESEFAEIYAELSHAFGAEPNEERRVFAAFGSYDAGILRAPGISRLDHAGFTDAVLTNLHRGEPLTTSDVISRYSQAVLGIDDAICNAFVRKRSGQHQIVFFSGMWRVYMARVITGIAFARVSNHPTFIAGHDDRVRFNKKMLPALRLPHRFYFGFWDVECHHFVKEFNVADREKLDFAICGSFLFVFLHEIGHIELGHTKSGILMPTFGRSSEDSEAEIREYQADAYAFKIVRPELREAMLGPTWFVLEILADLDLILPQLRRSHPFVIARMNRIIEENLGSISPRARSIFEETMSSQGKILIESLERFTDLFEKTIERMGLEEAKRFMPDTFARMYRESLHDAETTRRSLDALLAAYRVCRDPV